MEIYGWLLLIPVAVIALAAITYIVGMVLLFGCGGIIGCVRALAGADRTPIGHVKSAADTSPELITE
ncbi:MAG: hypothetical protein ACYC7C_04160 [Coriobacteriia bacterium]